MRSGFDPRGGRLTRLERRRSIGLLAGRVGRESFDAVRINPVGKALDNYDCTAMIHQAFFRGACRYDFLADELSACIDANRLVALLLLR